MTLDTRMFVQGEVDPREFFDEVRRLLKATPAHEVKADDSSIWHPPGIGLDAWAILYRNGDGSWLRPDAAACSEYCDAPDDVDEGEEPHHSHPPRHYALLSLDTAYGYRSDDGEGCGQLHVRFLSELGRWLDDRDVAWAWENEFTGEIHEGEDRWSRLPDLAGGGAKAEAWFHTKVVPAIAIDIARRS